MSDKSELMHITQDFLKSVAEATEKNLGPNPQIRQSAGWLVREGSGRSGQHFERMTFDREKVSMFYQLELGRSDFPEKKRLQNALLAVGIPEDEIPFGFIHPLINRWLNLSYPFSFEEPVFSNLLEEFAEVVLSSKAVKNLRIVIEGLDADYMPVEFSDGIIIRSINEEELWMLGDHGNLQSRHQRFPGYYPDSDWKILDIRLRFNREKNDVENITLNAAYATFDAVLALLRLESSGRLGFIDFGSRNNFGMNSVGYSSIRGRIPQEVGRYEGYFYLDKEKIKNLQSHWPKVLAIIRSNSHYLRLSTMRLIDGGSRSQPRDAIIDYVIGLESLLGMGEKNEISYKFALRGATILSWDGGTKKDFYNNLHDIYKIRSSIVHGGNIKEKRLTIEEAHHIARDYLRKIWWWYFNKNIPSTDKGREIIDDRIIDP